MSRTPSLGGNKTAPKRRPRRIGIEQLEPRMLLTAGPLNNVPYIDLGTSDNVAWDQPRVAVELITNEGGGLGSVGPTVFNTFLLDTGANSVLAFATAVRDMAGPPHVYRTAGVYEEIGVAGSQFFNISAPYRVDFSGTSGVRNTVNDGTQDEYSSRILSDPINDVSIFGPWGIAGMPAMIDRVTTLDMTPWTVIRGFDLFMHVEFSDTLPADPGGRYTIAVDNEPSFSTDGHVISGNSPPVWADIPFLDVYPVHNGQSAHGNFLFDTGAQLSIMSSRVARDMGLDSNGDGVFDEKDANFARNEQVGGVGGTITAPVFLFDEVHVPTEQGIDLVWTDLQWLILDIHPDIEGIFGSDLITSGWIEAFAVDGNSGYFMQSQLDFRELRETGRGQIHFDLNPEVHQVIDPQGAGAQVIETGDATTVSETGIADTYQLVLTQQPAADVRVDLTNTEGQLLAVDNASPGQAHLIFTPQNWDTPQTVRVTAIDDAAEEGFRRSSIVHVSTSSDEAYRDVGMPRVVTNIIDNDQPGVMMIPSDGATEVSEGGSGDTYQIVLTRAPLQAVTIQLENVAGQVIAVDANSPSNNFVQFNRSNWDQPQTVAVTAVDDAQSEGPHKTFVTHRIETSDETYQQAFVLQEPVAIADNDQSPEVLAQYINGAGNSNRSAVASLTFEFDQPVTIDQVTSLQIVNHTTGTPVDISSATIQNNGTNQVSWRLAGIPFADGNYTALLPKTATTGQQGRPLASTQAMAFHVLSGDSNGNRLVDFADFSAVAANFNTSGGPILGPGDLNADGDVNFADFSILAQQFNRKLSTIELDFGDAPESGRAYPTRLSRDGARHVLGGGLSLGNTVDGEADGQPSASGLGDDSSGDDEDGVTLPSLRPGTKATITVDVDVPDGLSAFLNGWIDFNADGDWDDVGERILTDLSVVDGPNGISAAVPATAVAGATFARFRISSDVGHSYYGLARNGEVEDYQVTILPAAARAESAANLGLRDLLMPPLAGPRSWPVEGGRIQIPAAARSSQPRIDQLSLSEQDLQGGLATVSEHPDAAEVGRFDRFEGEAYLAAPVPGHGGGEQGAAPISVRSPTLLDESLLDAQLVDRLFELDSTLLEESHRR